MAGRDAALELAADDALHLALPRAERAPRAAVGVDQAGNAQQYLAFE
jgi:hypothetical protein